MQLKNITKNLGLLELAIRLQLNFQLNNYQLQKLETREVEYEFIYAEA